MLSRRLTNNHIYKKKKSLIQLSRVIPGSPACNLNRLVQTTHNIVMDILVKKLQWCLKSVTKLSWRILWKKNGWMRRGWMADGRVIHRSDYNVSCLDTAGYVTAGNSPVVSQYQTSVGTHHCHLQSRIDETIHMKTCISLYRQYKCSDNVPFLQFGTPQFTLKFTYSLQLNDNFSHRNTKHVRQVNGFNPPDCATF